MKGVIHHVPCGKCNYCLANKRADWSFRLNHELAAASTGVFLTITYDDADQPKRDGVPTLCKRDLQLFIKRLRKENDMLTDSQLRYYAVGEYGTKTHRPHYHALMFNLDLSLVNDLPKIWGKGHMHAGTLTPASIHYVTKYVINKTIDTRDLFEAPFAVMSRRPGIGSGYIKSHGQWHKDSFVDPDGVVHEQVIRNFAQQHGHLLRLPRYFKDKMFDPAAKARMAEEALPVTAENYRKEIDRLSMLMDDPYAYYEERRAYNHDLVIDKMNQQNKF